MIRGLLGRRVADLPSPCGAFGLGDPAMFQFRVTRFIHRVLTWLHGAPRFEWGAAWRLTALAAACVAAGTSGFSAETRPQLWLEIDMAVERGATAAVLFDFGDGIWGENGSTATVPPGATPTRVRLALPARPVRGLRFDPTSDDQPILISAMRVADAQGRVLRTLDLGLLRPMNQIAAITAEAGGVRVQPLAKADDPMLRIDLNALQQGMHEGLQWPTVGRGMVVGLALLLGACMAFGGFAASRTVAAGRPWLGALGIFAVVFGARLLWLNLFSRTVPFWDEWEGDAAYVLIPFAGGFLDWPALFMPQWEHRIFLTRTITLCGTLVNGEWDPRVAMTMSAFFLAATIALVGLLLLATRRRAAALAAGLLTVFAALPYDFNNLLWGGQTQMYGLILLAVCTLTIAAAPRVDALTCLGAGAAGLVSLFTMGAGPVAPGCAVGVCLMRSWFEPAQRRRLLGLAAVFFAIALLGVSLHVSSRAHSGFYATNFGQFQRAFVGVLAWPLPPWIFCAVLLWWPVIVNARAVWRRRGGTALEWLAVGLGAWAAIDALALGYARQYEGPPFDSRFFTPISVGALASLLSCATWIERTRSHRARGVAFVTIMAMAIAWIGYGRAGLKGAAASRIDREDREDRVRRFLATGNRTVVMEKPPHAQGEPVLDRLESPLLQRILSAAFRRELAARPGRAALAGAEPGPITTLVRTLMKVGPFFAVLGLVALSAHVWRSRRAWPPWQIPPRETATSMPRPTRTRADWIDLACHVIAAVVVIGWFFIYANLSRGGLVDEPGHVADVHHFLDEKSGWPESMPMLPGYHFVVLSLWKACPGLTTTMAARATTTLFTLFGLGCFALAWRRLHGGRAGLPTLLLALLPLAHPFTAMAYTDWPALALVLAAWWAQLTGHRALAVVALAAAVAVRQTNLIWAGFFLAWEFLRDDEPRATFLRRCGWLLAFLAAAAVLILAAGRLTLGSQHGNDFKFNIASLHFGGALLLVLGLPVWIAHLAPTFARWREATRVQPAKVTAAAAAALGLTVVGTITFANPHIWNRELYWEGCTFTLLRNWPLVCIDTHPVLRVVSSFNVVAMAIALTCVIHAQRHRPFLWLVVAFGLLPVFTNSLVEPRYFIPLAGLLLCFLEISPRTGRTLAVWWALLTIAHAPFVVRGLSLW